MMDWKEYKRRCDGPSVMSRWALETSMSRLDDGESREALARVLSASPIDKPTDHGGGPETDCFALDVDAAVAHEVIDALEHRVIPASAPREGGRLRHLVIVWKEFLALVEPRTAGR